LIPDPKSSPPKQLSFAAFIVGCRARRRGRGSFASVRLLVDVAVVSSLAFSRARCLLGPSAATICSRAAVFLTTTVWNGFPHLFRASRAHYGDDVESGPSNIELAAARFRPQPGGGHAILDVVARNDALTKGYTVVEAWMPQSVGCKRYACSRYLLV